MTEHQSQPPPPLLLGHSPAMRSVRAAIAMAARTDAKVLIVGETGVGKDVVAQLIHVESRRARHPYVPVNCSGIPETLLESELFGHTRGSFTGAYRDKPGLIRRAHHGTLFLDEVGEMTLRMQATLLRFTETGEIQPIGADRAVGSTDVRLISATNRDLRAHVANGTFREDLYYRLNVLELVVPPLRERVEDIPILLQHYGDRAAQTHGGRAPTFTPEAAQLLLAYEWPGNIRELRSLTERIAVKDLPRPVTPDDLPSEIRGSHGTRPVVPTVMPHDSTHAGVAPISERVQRLWERMEAGEDFWTVVHEPFKAREVTRADVVALIDRGLRQTKGSYRDLLGLFRLPSADYKRFHQFLYDQQCSLPVMRYRLARASVRRGDRLRRDA